MAHFWPIRPVPFAPRNSPEQVFSDTRLHKRFPVPLTFLQSGRYEATIVKPLNREQAVLPVGGKDLK